MIHGVSGKGRLEECLLELDMDTGRCRIAALPGMGENLKLRWFTENWLLVQGNGEILSDDFAQLINMTTREAVSYTHLDVDKRQPQLRGISEGTRVQPLYPGRRRGGFPFRTL